MSIDNTDDVIDSRDVIARIEQLQALREPGPVPDGALDDADMEQDQDVLFRELAALESLAKQGAMVDDWEHGAALIRDSYFETYAQELADDLGVIKPGAAWPNNCIDWEQAARELQMGYTSVEFAGVTYWVR